MDIAIAASPRVGMGWRFVSLHAMLRDLHIPTVDHEARRHQKKMINDHRVGIYKLIGPALYFLATVASAVFGRIWAATSFLFAIIGILQVAATFIFLLIGTGLLWAVTALFHGPSMIFMVLFLSTIAAGAVFFGFLIFVAHARRHMSDKSWQNLENALSTWQELPVHSFEYKSLHNAGIPDRLHARARLAHSIPGTVVHVVKFKFDPLLCVTRQYGPFKLLRETAYIGGWDTNNPAIDMA